MTITTSATSAGATTTIDYEEVVASYQESLTSTLRGFRPASVFLETWVHDEDIVSSLVNMAEAAEGAGLGVVVIRLAAETARALSDDDRARLARRGERLGRVTIASAADGAVEVHVAFREQPLADDACGENPATRAREPRTAPRSSLRGSFAPPQTPQWTSSPASGESGASGLFAARYGQALSAFATHDHEGRLEAAGQHVLIEAADGGVTLGALIDPSSRVIRAARHYGACGDTQKRLLAALCTLLEGKPMDEASDHGVIRLEHMLRDRAQPRAVAGIVLPENADPAFALLVRLTRDLYARYRAIARVPRARNEFDPPPRKAWLDKGERERMSAIQSALDLAAPAVDLAPGDVVCAHIDRDVKITIAFTREIAPQLKARLLMRLEQSIKSRVEPALSVYVDEMHDKNKIRRLVLNRPSEAKGGTS